MPLLLDALAQQGLDVADIDFVFLTHIHLDHAGGAGLLMQHLPNARCVLHPRGAPHMASPEKLIAGTIGVYGEERTREMYGDIVPIEESRIIVAEDGDWFDLASVEVCSFRQTLDLRDGVLVRRPGRPLVVAPQAPSRLQADRPAAKFFDDRGQYFPIQIIQSQRVDVEQGQRLVELVVAGQQFVGHVARLPG